MLGLKRPARRIVRLGDAMPDRREVESVIREVLHRELRLNNVGVDEDLIALDRDFPTGEVVKDVVEEFGQRPTEPKIDDWSGTLGDLIRVVYRELG